MKWLWSMSSLSNTDIYDKEHLLVSIDKLSPELLYRLTESGEEDAAIEKLKGGLEFAMGFLSEDELDLLFFRFIHGNSYKTLKKNIHIGSTKTAAKRIKKLKKCIQVYVAYYLNNNYEEDLAIIKGKLDEDHVRVADMLFRRMSKNAILRSDKIIISQNRLARTIGEIELLCLRTLSMSGFWKVLISIGKISPKNK